MNFIQQLNFFFFKMTRYHTHFLFLWSLLFLFLVNLTSIDTIAYCQQDAQIENNVPTKVENQDYNSYFYLNTALLLAFSILIGYNMYNHMDILVQQIELQKLIIATLEEDKAVLSQALSTSNPVALNDLTTRAHALTPSA